MAIFQIDPKVISHKLGYFWKIKCHKDISKSPICSRYPRPSWFVCTIILCFTATVGGRPQWNELTRVFPTLPTFKMTKFSGLRHLDDPKGKDCFYNSAKLISVLWSIKGSSFLAVNSRCLFEYEFLPFFSA